jgi:oligoendopeptidase F
MKSYKNNIKILSIVMMSIIMLMKCSAPADKAGEADDDAQMSKDRADIPDNYKWNLDDMYAAEEDWENAKEELPAKFDKAAGFKGTLGKSASNLFIALEYMERVAKELSIFRSYASMLSDSDIRESGPLGMDQEANQLYTKFGAAAAYVDPEILSIPERRLNKFFRDEPKLEKFRQYIDNVYRMKTHTLNASEENLIAEAGIMQGNSGNIYSVFSNAEMPRAEITLSNGEKVVLDASAYALYRASTNREDRKLVFDSFFKKIDEFKMTLGTQLYGKVKENMFVKNVRNYNSCLEASLNSNNIPTSVYHKLIENANKNLPTLHRYLELKKRMMGLDELHYYDIYAPLVNNVDLRYSYEEGYDMVTQALAVLGDEYVNTLQEAFDGRWIDVYPNTVKRSGAYSNGSAYDVHPYILLNYNGQYEDVGTLAHELGHTMHSYFSNKHQPFINANYPIFLAEVASTANEALLMDHVLKQIDDPQIKLSILGNYLENARATLFRQTQFAEFELKIHELAEKGESLTGDKFSEIYLEILKKYYGHEDGVMVIDDVYAIEWAYIPHFYYNFYVFQYSTSFTASTMLAEQMLKGDEEMIDKYIDFLSSGNSEYAIPTLKKVGIDMETDEPFEVTMAKMNKVMDDIEAILDEIG